MPTTTYGTSDAYSSTTSSTSFFDYEYELKPSSKIFYAINDLDFKKTPISDDPNKENYFSVKIIKTALRDLLNELSFKTTNTDKITAVLFTNSEIGRTLRNISHLSLPTLKSVIEVNKNAKSGFKHSYTGLSIVIDALEYANSKIAMANIIKYAMYLSPYTLIAVPADFTIEKSDKKNVKPSGLEGLMELAMFSGARDVFEPKCLKYSDILCLVAK
jgi:hypothetical protein